MLPDEICGNCRFFVRKAKQDNTGECRKHAPHPSPLKMVGASGLVQRPFWPEVDIDSGCGEFEREAPQG